MGFGSFITRYLNPMWSYLIFKSKEYEKQTFQKACLFFDYLFANFMEFNERAQVFRLRTHGEIQGHIIASG